MTIATHFAPTAIFIMFAMIVNANAQQVNFGSNFVNGPVNDSTLSSYCNNCTVFVLPSEVHRKTTDTQRIPTKQEILNASEYDFPSGERQAVRVEPAVKICISSSTKQRAVDAVAHLREKLKRRGVKMEYECDDAEIKAYISNILVEDPTHDSDGGATVVANLSITLTRKSDDAPISGFANNTISAVAQGDAPMEGEDNLLNEAVDKTLEIAANKVAGYVVSRNAE